MQKRSWESGSFQSPHLLAVGIPPRLSEQPTRRVPILTLHLSGLRDRVHTHVGVGSFTDKRQRQMKGDNIPGIRVAGLPRPLEFTLPLHTDEDCAQALS